MQDNECGCFQWVDPKIYDRGKEVVVILSNQRDGLKEKLRLVEEMKELAGEKAKMLEEKTVKLKILKANMEDELGKIENEYAKL